MVVTTGLLDWTTKKGDITDIEKVKKRATKLIISLKNCSYKERLQILNLPTLKYEDYGEI